MLDVFLTAYMACNLGDDLFITILCERYPSVNFYLFCSEPYTVAFKNIKNITVISEL